MYAPAFLLAFFLRKRYYINMYKVLRILFCAVAVAGTACTVFIFIYFGIWGLLPLAVACVSAALMFLFRNKQEAEEKKQSPSEQGDFITGKAQKPDNEQQ